MNLESSVQFVAVIESAFGSDKALGVCFVTDDGEHLSLDAYETMLAERGMENMPGCQSLFPDGSSAVCCTEYAVQVFRGLPGRVQIVGFSNDKNPASRVARECIHPGGHDFALVDDRYLVDPWIRLVAAASDQIVFDLADARDSILVTDIYGPRTAWSRLHEAERLAKGKNR